MNVRPGSMRGGGIVLMRTVVEAGFPNLVAEDFVGFVVKTGTPVDSSGLDVVIAETEPASLARSRSIARLSRPS